MQGGLRIWDEEGNLIVDGGTRLGTILGMVDTGTSSGSVSHAGLSNGVAFFSAMPLGQAVTQIFAPIISVQGDTLSWTFVNNGLSENRNTRIIYGYY